MADGDDDHHEHQAHEGDAEGTLPPIDVAILFPALGAPCVVEPGAQWVELLIATSKTRDDLISVGNIAHYLYWRPFAELRDSRANQGAPPAPRVAPDPDRLRWLRPSDLYISEESWPLVDLRRGDGDTSELTTEDLDGAPAPPPPTSSGAPVEEKPRHTGQDGAAVELARPIFPITTCRLHAFAVSALEGPSRRALNVFRVLIRASVFPVGQMGELVWTSETPRAAFIARLKEYDGARGAVLRDDAYDELELRHPFLVSAEPIRSFAHLTDIHNSAAHNLLNLTPVRVLDDPARPSDDYSPIVGTRMNNYNRAFSRLCHQASDENAQAFVLTGDLVDYGRGPWYPSSAGGSDERAAWMPSLLAAGERGFPVDGDPAAGSAEHRPNPIQIWDQLGGDEQNNYVTNANFKYFIEHKILPRYLEGKPVFTLLGNHDFHPHPFAPWPTDSGRADPVSFNPLTPSDYNLTRYEALLGYGPKSYEAYKMSAVWFTMLGLEGGGNGAISTPRCCGVYFCFVNPFVDYGVCFGDRSILLVDFGRLEVRPQGITRSFFRAGMIAALIGALAVLAGIGLLALAGAGLVTGGWATALTVIAAILLTLGILAVIVGGVIMLGTAGAGALEPDFEDTDLLPAAQHALGDEQLGLLDAWTWMSHLGTRALFCHALVAGRPPRFVSIDQLNAHPEAATVDLMKYGVLAHGREAVIDQVRQRKIAVTMSGHSHYTSLYRLGEDGRSTTVEWPPRAGHTQSPAGGPGRGDRLINVTRAAGPMAELNNRQVDRLDGNKSIALDRQVRGAPGASLLTLEDGGQATVEQLECDLPTAQPRRAAFDSWKERLDSLKSDPVDGDDVRFTLLYLSDVWEPLGGSSGQRPSPQWSYALAAISFFLDGRRIQAALTPGEGGRPSPDEPPSERAQSQPGYTAHRYVFTLAAADFRRFLQQARRGSSVACAIEYPEAGEDPWIFDVTVEQSGSDLDAVYTLRRTEFPDFDARRRRYAAGQAPPR